jgi:hypothetical protein
MCSSQWRLTLIKKWKLALIPRCVHGCHGVFDVDEINVDLENNLDNKSNISNICEL